MIIPTLKPLWYTLPAWYARSIGINRQIRSIHRRGGKDVSDFSMTVQDAIEYGGTHYYLFPTRTLGIEAIIDESFEFNGVMKHFWEWCIPKGVKAIWKDKAHCVYFPHNGARIVIDGTDDLSVVGRGGKSYTMSEFSLHKEEVTGFIAPILRQSNAAFRANGTLRGKDNQLYRMLMANKDNPEWFCQWLKPQDTKCYCWISDEFNINPELYPLIGQRGPNNGIIFNVQDEIDSGMISMALARQEFLNEVLSDIENNYFGHELDKAQKDGRIGNFGGIRNNTPLLTAWDIGGATQQSDNTSAVLIQEQQDTLRIVGFYDKRGESIGGDIANIRRMSQGARFGGHFAPHDAKKTSKQTQLDLLEYCKREFKFEFRRVRKTDKVRRDIEICRRMFPKIEIDLDGENMETFLDLLYRYREDPKTERPLHKGDDSSHAGDALRTGLMAKHYGLLESYLNNDWYEEIDDGHDDGGIYMLDT